MFLQYNIKFKTPFNKINKNVLTSDNHNITQHPFIIYQICPTENNEWG